MPRARMSLRQWNTPKPESELRPWSTYRSVGEWYTDFHHYVPQAMALALAQRMAANPSMTFPEVYGALLGRRASIAVHEGDEPPCRICELLHGPVPAVDAETQDRRPRPLHRGSRRGAGGTSGAWRRR